VSSSEILYRGVGGDNKEINVECTSHNSQDIEQWKPTLYKCKLCKLVFSESIGVDFAEKYIDVIDQSYLDQIEFKKKTFELFFRKIKKFLNKDHKILEIGAYYGILGNLINPHVKEYHGLELSTHAANYAKKNFNLNMITEKPEEYLEKNNKYDLIIMTDVIEHLDNPFKVLSLIEKNLNEGGQLILSTFNFDSMFSKIMGKKYPWIIPMHKYYFTNTTIKNCLNKSNLELFDIQNDVRLISVEYLFQKFNVIFSPFKFISRVLLKFKFIKNLTIKINLYDLKIYFCKKR
jgi:2-polyprenyl-3-methyl-5-hydroxy-6-metoxy-1,4-benzoquinol methylase